MGAVDKKYKMTSAQIRNIAPGYGACFATDKITVEGAPVGFMYREDPDNDIDSGWRFLAGTESEEYMDNPDNHAIYDVNTIANYDPDIVPLLDAPSGSVFERVEGEGFIAADRSESTLH
jgi:hypothetical protein